MRANPACRSRRPCLQRARATRPDDRGAPGGGIADSGAHALRAAFHQPIAAARRRAPGAKRSPRSSSCRAVIDRTRSGRRPACSAFQFLRRGGCRRPGPRTSDARRAAGQRRAPLDGIPVGLKDVDRRRRPAPGPPRARCSRTLFRPMTRTVTGKLKEAGAICWGRLNLDEFAMGSSTEQLRLSQDRPAIPGTWSGRPVAPRAQRAAAACAAERSCQGARLRHAADRSGSRLLFARFPARPGSSPPMAPRLALWI